MANINIQITQISNGFMVASPPTNAQIQTMQRENQQPQPVINYCEDYFDVIKELERVWPFEIKHVLTPSITKTVIEGKK